MDGGERPSDAGNGGCQGSLDSPSRGGVHQAYCYCARCCRRAYPDSVIRANHMNSVQKDRYIKDIQKQLFKSYEGIFRQMTIYDGALMMKLIDRETGMSSYDIIKEYKNGVAAGFWQGIAKLFENDLKSTYDPTGADSDTELLVQAWKAGEFPALYWSVFWEDPPVADIGEIKLEK